MISLTEVIRFKSEMYARAIKLVASKGHDYNRVQQKDGDTLYNLRVAANMGIVSTPEKGILVRLSDKFMRLISLTGDRGVEAQVTDESVLDTVVDIHNYIDYLAMFYMETRLSTAADEGNYFYLAGSYKDREILRLMSALIESETGMRNGARWLEHDLEKYDKGVNGQMDFADVVKSDIFIVDCSNSPSTGGGRWVEFGMAYALNKPIYLIGEATSVFTYMEGVNIVADEQDLYNAIRLS